MLLPSSALNDDISLDFNSRLSDFAYFDRHVIINLLKTSGYDTAIIDVPYNPSPIPGAIWYAFS